VARFALLQRSDLLGQVLRSTATRPLRALNLVAFIAGAALAHFIAFSIS
jgi:hypothetical protein